MALWIIVIILVIVCFPALLGVAVVGATVIFLFASLAIGIGLIVGGIYCAGKAATQPSLAQWAAVIALAANILLLPWVTKHGGGDISIWIAMLEPIVSTYGLAMLLVYKRHGAPSRRDKLSALFLLLGGISCALAIMPVFGIHGIYADLGSIYTKYTILKCLGAVPMIAGIILMLLQPPYSKIAREENLGIQVIAGAEAVSYGLNALVLPTRISIPFAFKILRLVTLIGLIVFVLPTVKKLISSQIGKK